MLYPQIMDTQFFTTGYFILPMNLSQCLEMLLSSFFAKNPCRFSGI